MPQNAEALNISRALGFVKRRGFWIVLCVVLAGAAAYGLSKRETKKYTATATLVFNTNQLSQQIAGLATTSNNLVLQQANNLELVHLGNMAERTASILGQGLTAAKVAASLSISGQVESSIVGVSSTATSGKLAAAIANTYTRQFVQEQTNSNRHFFRSALALVRKQLAALSPDQRIGTDGLNLQNRAQSLALLSELQPNTVELAQAAPVPTSPSSPRSKRNALIGAVLGLVLGFALAALLERLDPRIRAEEELSSIYDAPLLGVVPRSKSLARSGNPNGEGPFAISTAEAEAFHSIRARLRSFNADRDIRTVLITSPSAGEGKTTVALHLAGAAARMGSRVLLLEADLRNPRLAQRLGITSQFGLPGVLNQSVGLDAATQSLVAGTGYGSSRLDVLPAGSAAQPNPVELIESYAMDALLKQVRFAYDLVIIDAPELAVVTDAFLMLSKVDGLIVVGSIDQGRRDVAERLGRTLVTSGAPLVGVIANRVKNRGVNVKASSSGTTPAHGSENVTSPTRGSDVIETAQR